MTRRDAIIVASDEDDSSSSVLLDQLLLEVGCFDKPCRPEALERICKFAVEPFDRTAEVVIADGGENVNGETERNHYDKQHHNNNRPLIQAALTANSDSETLFLHNFIECKRKRGRPCGAAVTKTTASPFTHDAPATATFKSSVKQLCLSHCTVHADTSNFLASLKHLKVLIVWNCTVLQGLERLTSSLEGLVLVDCCISQNTLEQILQKSTPQLQRFALIRSGNLPNLQKRSSYYVSDPAGFSQALRRTASITTLVLGDSMLPDPEFANTLLNYCPQLETLSLKQTLLSDTFAVALARALAATRTLKELVLEQVRWSPFGAVVLADAIRENTSLENLDLSQTLWFGPHPVNALKRMLEENTSLEHIQLNRLEYSSLLCSLGAVVEGIARNGHLTKISLAGNHLDADAMTGLQRILQSHASLRDLSLCDCYAPDGWEPVLLALAHNTRLERLSLEDCRIGNVAAKAIGTILSTNTCLQLLDLCHNDIDDDEHEGTPCLVDGLRRNQTLTRIFLHGNDIGRRGSELLRDVVRDSNLSLRVVFLPTSPLQEEMQYYGSINYAGRKYIGDNSISFALWPNILARVSQRPDMLAYLLQRKPELCQRQEENPHRRNVLVGGRKRRRDELSAQRWQPDRRIEMCRSPLKGDES